MTHRGTALLLALALLPACAGLPDNTSRLASGAYLDARNSRFSEGLEEKLARHPGLSGTVLLPTGVDAFVARAVLAELAEVSIDTQYYLFHSDLTGKLFTYYLLRAADRGVRVRLLVDDMAIEGSDLAAAAMDSHPNIEVRIFNPFSRDISRTVQYVTRLGSVTRRMHNKSFTVDNTVSILGGRNIGDEYFGANPEIAFSDLDVMGFGPFVPKVSESFDRYWNSKLSYPALSLARDKPTAAQLEQLRSNLQAFAEENRNSAYAEAMRNSALANSLRSGTTVVHFGEADVLADQPEKVSSGREHDEYHLSSELKPYIEGITKEFLVVSPYFVPGKAGVAFLRDLVRRGIRVLVLTNALSSTDVPMVHAGYSRYREDLLRAGVELYELDTRGVVRDANKKGIEGSSGASLHAKTFIIDRRQVFIGSMNLDPRSRLENTEIGMILTSPGEVAPMAAELEDWIKRSAFRLELQSNGTLSEEIVWHGIDDGKPVTYRVDPYSSVWTRFLVDFFRLLPIESQL